MTLPPDSAALAERAATWNSAYVHIPFCHRICPYCDFAVVAGRSELVDRYVAAVVREIRRDDPRGPLDAIFVGGGTPSRLNVALLAEILDALDGTHGIAGDAEITTEANPEDWEASYSDGVAAAGFTRVSLGVQSFDSKVLEALGRVHTADQAIRSIRNARAGRFASVNVDLIFGTPGESVQSWAKSVATALGEGVDHLSTYGLTVERGTKLSREVAAGAPAPDEDDQATKWELADEAIKQAGMVRYEVSNAASLAHPCRYNLSTWAQGDYAGYGMGAHGHRAGTRSRNYRRLEAYLEAVEAGRMPIQGQETLPSHDREVERLMLGLRRTAGVEPGVGGARLLASAEGRRLADAGVIALRHGRLIVERPLLTDAAIRAVMALEDIADAAAHRGGGGVEPVADESPAS